MNIKVGDRVQSKDGLTGVVKRVREAAVGAKRNDVSRHTPDQGTIEVLITDLTEEYLRKSSGWRPVGAKEYFILEGWEKVLRIL